MKASAGLCSAELLHVTRRFERRCVLFECWCRHRVKWRSASVGDYRQLRFIHLWRPRWGPAVTERVPRRRLGSAKLQRAAGQKRCLSAVHFARGA
jgi:hypothetical protein